MPCECHRIGKEGTRDVSTNKKTQWNDPRKKNGKKTNYNTSSESSSIATARYSAANKLSVVYSAALTLSLKDEEGEEEGVEEGEEEGVEKGESEEGESHSSFPAEGTMAAVLAWLWRLKRRKKRKAAEIK